jgi:hypothetical protein
MPQFALFVGRPEEGAVMLSRELLPLEVKRRGLSGLARAFAAAVLMNDDPAECFHTRRNPDCVADAKDQIPGLRGRLVTDAVIRRLGGRERVLREEGAGHAKGEE